MKTSTQPVTPSQLKAEAQAELLKACLTALNEIPNHALNEIPNHALNVVPGFRCTYALAAALSDYLKR
ncbi:cobalamin biosynthesis protein CbiX [Rouxiella badensis]|uniref:cobalamin biosynthesis protein CbiX n=1 Tax=Rouxiella badensis TaxID=1646377 RepID=UPI001D1419CA|nr:cobalamin biosynthesis protein CbiX [Rouxiella badensis]MCC3705480.1 cobalamin biosynthesis protein CbiX [Rouxiella badensis]